MVLVVVFVVLTVFFLVPIAVVACHYSSPLKTTARTTQTTTRTTKTKQKQVQTDRSLTVRTRTVRTQNSFH